MTISSLLSQLPNFDAFNAQKTAETIVKSCKAYLDDLEHMLQQEKHHYRSLVLFLEHQSQQLSTLFSPLSHLNNVMGCEDTRNAYEHALQALVSYQTTLGQSRALCSLCSQLARDVPSHDRELTRWYQHQLEQFKHQGIMCNEHDRKKLATWFKELSERQNTFQNHVTDATDQWHMHFAPNQPPKGLPKRSLYMAQGLAQAQGKKGYVFNLQAPCYIAIMTHAEDAHLRETFYKAYVTRASSVIKKCSWDNATIMTDILRIRQAIAKILDFSSYAEKSIARKMAESVDEIENFLEDLKQKSLPKALSERSELEQFARTHLSMQRINSWDMAFVTEAYKKHTLDIDDERLRPYFGLSSVLQALFDLSAKLFSIRIERCKEPVSTWHPDASFYVLYDRQDKVIAGFYLDLFARSGKRQGAWFDEAQSRFIDSASQTHDYPIAYLTCNFSPPSATSHDAELSHHEALTLFHEFGHGLHHMLTTIQYPSISGINQVAWDAVELPSQLMENWLWQPAFLKSFAMHAQTKQPIDDELVYTIQSSRTYLSGLAMMRQLEFATFDIKLHNLNILSPTESDIQNCLDQVRDDIGLPKPPAYNRFQNSFSHIFAGGYAAGYYSYKWAEVLSCDAFWQFEKHGLYSAKMGSKFLYCFLSQGGVADPKSAFEAFKNGPISTTPLLTYAGILQEAPATESN